ncbi:MAG: HD domain-containing protein [Chloroflexota bacterium]
MKREEALNAIRLNVKNENLVKHMLATEAIMHALARRFGEDEETWGTAGLLHDIDVELTRDDMMAHSKLGSEMVLKLGVSLEIAHAVLCHNQRHQEPFQNQMDRALYCVDPLTGLITATALVYPEKKLALVEVRSVEKRFRQPRFAAGANREQISACKELLGLELTDFIEIGLQAMKSIASDLGL